MMQRFQLGRILVMPEVAVALHRSGQDPDFFLEKHASGDWGATDPAINEHGLRQTLAVVSQYETLLGEKFRVATYLQARVTYLYTLKVALDSPSLQAPPSYCESLPATTATNPAYDYDILSSDSQWDAAEFHPSLDGVIPTPIPASELTLTVSDMSLGYDYGAETLTISAPFEGVHLDYQYDLGNYNLLSLGLESDLTSSELTSNCGDFGYDPSVSQVLGGQDISTPAGCNIPYDTSAMISAGPNGDFGVGYGSAFPPPPESLPPTPPPSPPAD